MRNRESRPGEIRVLGLEPVAAPSALMEAAFPFRHNAFEAKLARLGEHTLAPGGERILNKSSGDACDGRSREVVGCKSSTNEWITFAAVPCVLFKRGTRNDRHDRNPGDRIRSFIERVKRIDEEIKALNEGKKEVLAEAKGEGFDVKVLKEILRLRKLDQDEREEHESLLDLYLRAMEGAGAPEAEAA